MLPLTVALYNANNVATASHIRTIRFMSPLDLTDCELAVERLQVPISWPNVNSMNAAFSYVWVDSKSYTVTLQPGELSLAAIASALQLAQFSNGHYLANSTTGASNYYLSLAFNSNLYRTVLTALPLPSSMPSGFTYGTSLSGAPAWSLPSSPQSAQLVIPPIPANGYGAQQPFGRAPSTTSFSALIGVAPGSYPPAPSAVPYATAGTAAPMNLVQTVLVTCDRASCPYNTNNNLVYSFIPSAGYADLQDEQPSTPQWTTCISGKTLTLSVAFHDQNGMPLQLLDPAVHVRLTIRKRRPQ